MPLAPAAIVLLFLYFFHTAHGSLWTRILTVNGSSGVADGFSQLYYPIDVVDFHLPVHGRYVYYIPSYNSPHADMCDQGDRLASNCTAYFCDNHAAITALDEKTRVHHALMHNYCNYCITNKRNVSDFLQFHNVKSTCARFIPFSLHNCGNSNNHPFMLHLLLNATDIVPPFICYCDTSEKYGFQCDAWTNFFNTLSVVVLRCVFLVIGLIVWIHILLLCLIPECYTTASTPRNSLDTHMDRAQQFLSIRILIIVSCITTITLNIAEQSFSLFYFSKDATAIRPRINSGIFRAFCVFSCCISYASTLIMW